MPNEREPRYSLTELADLAGVTPRTVRYYISQGLLAVDATPGPGPKYDDGHLARLRLIKRLQREHQPLAEIRRQLDAVDDDTILALAAADEPSTAPTDSALDYIRRITGGRAEATAARIAEVAPDTVLRQASMPPALARPRFERTAHEPARSATPMTPAIAVTPAMAAATAAPAMASQPAARAAGASPAAPAAGASPTGPARIERSQWERVELAPDVELHIRRPSSRATAKRVDRLISIARDLFREDPS